MYYTNTLQVPFCTITDLVIPLDEVGVVSISPYPLLMDSKNEYLVTVEISSIPPCMHPNFLMKIVFFSNLYPNRGLGDRYPGAFRQFQRFTNEDIMVTLPDGVDACDIGTITIWCEPFTAFFSRLEVPRSVFVSGYRETEGEGLK